MKTPYQEACERIGKDKVDKLSRGAVDPMTGYIARHLNAAAELLDGTKPCQRCGGRGLWGQARLKVALCLPCQDEWMEVCSELLDKHGYVSSDKKWLAAFQEFCQTKPREVDIEKHNREVLRRDGAIKALLPGYFG